MKLITGNTYPVRAEIKALGSTWDKARSGWLVPDDKADEAQRLVDSAPASAPRASRRSRGRSRSYGSNYTRFSSGAEVYTNKGGRCIDAPCCGCCS